MGGAFSDLLSVSDHLRLGGSLAISYASDTRLPDGTSWKSFASALPKQRLRQHSGSRPRRGRVLLPIFSTTNLVLVASNQPVQKYFIATVQPLPGQLELRFTGDPGARYSIDISSDLMSWVSLLETNRPDGIIYFRESLTARLQRFYRFHQCRNPPANHARDLSEPRFVKRAPRLALFRARFQPHGRVRVHTVAVYNGCGIHGVGQRQARIVAVCGENRRCNWSRN